MRILSINNYQMQSQNTNKSKISFGKGRLTALFGPEGPTTLEHQLKDLGKIIKGLDGNATRVDDPKFFERFENPPGVALDIGNNKKIAALNNPEEDLNKQELWFIDGSNYHGIMQDGDGGSVDNLFVQANAALKVACSKLGINFTKAE